MFHRTDEQKYTFLYSSSPLRLTVPNIKFLLYIYKIRTHLGPTHPPIQGVPETLSLGVKRPGRKADHSPPSSAEVKNLWRYTSTPPIRLHGVLLSKKKHRDFRYVCMYVCMYVCVCVYIYIKTCIWISSKLITLPEIH
jgi:hypothetical protein